MATKSVIGSTNPRFRTITIGDAPIENNYDFPMCNEDGLIERREIKQLNHELVGFEYLQKIYGYILHFELNFNRIIDGVYVKQMSTIIDQLIDGATLQIIPRADRTDRFFNIILDMEGYDLGLLGNYAKAGMRLPIFKFKTNSLVRDLMEIIVVDPVSPSTTPAAGTGINSPIEGQMQV